MIQQSINQLIGTVGVAARLAPGFDERTALYQNKVKEKKLDKMIKTSTQGAVDYANKIEGEVGNVPNNVYANQLGNLADLYKQKENLYKERFNLRPSEATYAKMSSAQTQASEMRKLANKNARRKITDAINQDNKFKQTKENLVDSKKTEPLNKKEIPSIIKSEGFNPESETALTQVQEKTMASNEQKTDLETLKKMVKDYEDRADYLNSRMFEAPEGKHYSEEYLKSDARKKDINDTIFKNLNLKREDIDEDEFAEFIFDNSPKLRGRYTNKASFIKNKDEILEKIPERDKEFVLYNYLRLKYLNPEINRLNELASETQDKIFEMEE